MDSCGTLEMPLIQLLLLVLYVSSCITSRKEFLILLDIENATVAIMNKKDIKQSYRRSVGPVKETGKVTEITGDLANDIFTHSLCYLPSLAPQIYQQYFYRYCGR